MFKSLTRAARLSLANRALPASRRDAHVCAQFCSFKDGGTMSARFSAAAALTFVCVAPCHTSGVISRHYNLHDTSSFGGKRYSHTQAFSYDCPPHKRKAAQRIPKATQQQKSRSRNAMSSLSRSMLEQSLVADFIPWPVNEVQTRRKSMSGVVPRRKVETNVWASLENSLGRRMQYAHSVDIHPPDMEGEPRDDNQASMVDPDPVQEDSTVSMSQELVCTLKPASQPMVPESIKAGFASLSLEERLAKVRSVLDEATLSILTSSTSVQPYPNLPVVTSLLRKKLTPGCYMDLSNKQPTDDIFLFSSDPYLPENFSFYHSKPFPEGTGGFLYYHNPSRRFLAGELRFRVTRTPNPSSFSEGKDLRIPLSEEKRGKMAIWSIPVLSASSSIHRQLVHEKILSKQEKADMDFVIRQMDGEMTKGEQVVCDVSHKFEIDLSKYTQNIWVVGKDMRCGKVVISDTGCGLGGSLLVHFETTRQHCVFKLRIMEILEPIVVPLIGPKESPSSGNNNDYSERSSTDLPLTWRMTRPQATAKRDPKYYYIPEGGRVLRNPISGKPWNIWVDKPGAHCIRFLWPKV